MTSDDRQQESPRATGHGARGSLGSDPADNAANDPTQNQHGLRSATAVHTSSHATRARRDAFLAALSEIGVVTVAAAAAGVSRRVVYRWRQDDEEFAKSFDEALDQAHELLVAEARRRAADGFEEYVTSGGRLVMDPKTGKPLTQRKFSDHLLKYLIERRDGRPIQRIHNGESNTPKLASVEPAYVAAVLAELKRNHSLPEDG